MSTLTNLVTDIIAVRRLTRLIQEDRITESLREKVFDKFPPQTTLTGYLLTCSWCVSIWSGIMIFGLRKASPETANYVSNILAASEVTGRLTEKGF